MPRKLGYIADVDRGFYPLSIFNLDDFIESKVRNFSK